MTLTRIPRDIWFQVAQFVPEETLAALLNVNGAFFQSAMDVRYREITFQDFDKATMNLLQRLRDPAVSKRVRCFKLILSSEWPTMPTNLLTSLSGISFQQAMTEIILNFHNVTDYHVEWYDAPAPEGMVFLLTAAWKTFGSRLQKLSLSVENLKTIFVIPFYSRYLKELRVDLVLSELPETDEMLAATLAPVINKHASTLQLISFSCWDEARDFGPLFCAVAHIPNLRQLEILVDFHKCSLSDHRGVTRLLKDHNNVLKVVRLRPTLAFNWQNADPALVEWMTTNISDPDVLGNLESLDIRIPRASGHMELTEKYLSRSVESLTALSVMDNNLSYEEVERVVTCFSQTQLLETLGLQAWTMSPQLVDLLAMGLPNLKVLSLVVRKIHSHGEHPGYMSREDSDREHANFREEMQKRLYPEWKLYDISITRVCRDPFLSNIMAASVPSVSSFFGQGDMSIMWGPGGSRAGGRCSGQ